MKFYRKIVLPWTLARRLSWPGDTLDAWRAEIRGREWGRGYWEGGNEPSISPPARRSGERCKLPQRGLAQSPGKICILSH